jgi:peptidoglycan/LPS O-acetylase OafA/YrhL
MKRIPELDGVRGLACLQVLLLHYVAHQVDMGQSWLGRQAGHLVGMGWTGVDLFFVLSGFLLGGILLDYRRSPGALKVFYVRRACRILPIYFAWFALLLVLIHVPTVVALCTSSVPIWCFAVHLQNVFMVAHESWGPIWMSATWSLAIEEQFYLVLPAIIYFCPPRRLPAVLGVLMAGSLACRIVISRLWPGEVLATYMLLPCRADALFLGVLGAWAVRDPVLARVLRERVWLLRVATAGLGIGIVVFLSRCWIGSTKIKEFGFTWIAAFYLGLLLLTLHDRRCGAIFRWRPLAALGAISYGVYLFHCPLCWLFHSMLLGQPPRILDWASGGVTLLAFAATLGLAWTSYRFFEAPIIRLGRRWDYAPALQVCHGTEESETDAARKTMRRRAG